MEELHSFFDTITLCMRRHNVVRDVRRLILMLCIQDEYTDRHAANCVGLGYSKLLSIMLKPCFLARFVTTVATTGMNINPNNSSQGLGCPILLTKAATDFILTAGVLPDSHKLLINHPSEGLGILSADACTQIISAYIHQKGLKHPVYTKHFAVDEKLAVIVDDNFGTRAYICANEHRSGPYDPKILEWKNQPTIHLHYTKIIVIVQQHFKHTAKVRFITPVILESIKTISQYLTGRRQEVMKQIEKRNGREFIVDDDSDVL
jgi:hypothetical protein